MLIIEAEKMLDAGRLEMRTPWGSYIPIRRQSNTKNCNTTNPTLPVFMEAEVTSNITTSSLRFTGYVRVRR